MHEVSWSKPDPFPCFVLFHTLSFGLSKNDFLPKIEVKSNKSKNSNLNSVIETLHLYSEPNSCGC